MLEVRHWLPVRQRIEQRSPSWCGATNWASLQLTECTFVDLYRVLEVVGPHVQGGGGWGPAPLHAYHYHVEPRLLSDGLNDMECRPLTQRLLPRRFTNTFYNHLKTVPFDRAGVGR